MTKAYFDEEVEAFAAPRGLFQHSVSMNMRTGFFTETNMTQSAKLFRLLACAAGSAAIFLFPASADEPAPAPDTLADALKASHPILETRLRYEGVSQDGLSEDASAVTYRIRAGLETGAFTDTTFLVEFEHVGGLVDDYNSTINGKTGYPVVPDPEVTELNRLQLVNKSLPDTVTTLGRQRIALDDHRFIGNVGWRQNEQTFDAIRFQNTSFGKVTVDAGYIVQVNRIFGEDSPAGRWDGDSYFVNASLPTPAGKLSAFSYIVDVDQGGGSASSKTFGARLAGATSLGPGKLAYAGAFAQQNDYGSSTLDYSANYYLLDGSYSAGAWSAGAGLEVLGSDTSGAFQTPLATLHKFQGWADKFLVTPAGGVKDLYAKASFSAGDAGPFSGIGFLAVYHDFSAESGGGDYGSELDLQASAKWKSLGLALKFADYQADGFSTDTQKVWFEINWSL
jgi:hypothetical protein